MPFCRPRISVYALSTRWQDRYLFENDFYLLKKIWFGVATYICFIFKRVNKIKKKTLSVTPYFEKGGLWKTTLKWSWHGNWGVNQWILESIMHIWVLEYA